MNTCYDLFDTSIRKSSASIDDFVDGNRRIEIISNGGWPTPIPARWKPILGASDLLVLIPDMHMYLHSSVLDNFKFGAEQMYSFLSHTLQRQWELRAEGFRVNVCQLGDMFELCYPKPAGGTVDVNDIRTSHPIYGEIIGLFERLDTRYVAGNHDVAHHRRRGSHTALTDGSVYVEHGFTADSWYHCTDPSRYPWRMSMAALRAVRRVETGWHGLRRQLVRDDDTGYTALGISSGQVERVGLPNPGTYPGRILRHFTRMMYRAPWSQRPRICAVAHSHMPTLRTDFLGGEGIFIDAGAWTEGRSDFALITNDEVAICRYKRDRRAHARTRLRPAI